MPETERAPELNWPGQPRCRYCRAPLDRLRSGLGRCDRPVCAVRHRNEAARQTYRQQWNGFIDRLEDGMRRHGAEIATAAKELSVPAAELPIGIVPHQRRPARSLPVDRRLAFEAHLRAIISESFEHEPDDTLRDRRAAGEADEPVATQSACAACQGHCCILGAATHGFLKARTIDDVRIAHPELGPEEIFKAYIDRLPDEAVEDSCLYHGAGGCTNERSWRASICNDFQCNAKRRVIENVLSRRDQAVLWIGADPDSGESKTICHDVRDGPRELAASASFDDAAILAASRAAAATLPERIAVIESPPVASPGQACKICGNPISASQVQSGSLCGATICVDIAAGQLR